MRSESLRINSSLNTVDEAIIGGVGNPSGVSRYAGQLGVRFPLQTAEALAASDTSVGTLFGGIYQYVLTKAASTLAPARGRFCFWDPAVAGDYIVTPDDPGGTADVAGVYISAPTKGNHCIIQVEGWASVQCIASLTRTEGVGDVLVIGTNSDVDNIDSNDAIDGDNINSIVAIAIDLPVDATIIEARLWAPRLNY